MMKPALFVARTGTVAIHLLPALSVAGQLPLGPARTVPRATALATVHFYQRWVSPRKGFSCAYRLRFDDTSCSQHFVEQLAQGGLRHGLRSLRARMGSCRDANAALRSSAARPSDSDHRAETGETSSSEGASTTDQANDRQDSNACRAAECGDASCDGLDCLSSCDVC